MSESTRPGRFRGVIFDLDGVLVSTDAIHLAAWREMAAEWGLVFPEEIADDLRGVSRMASLEIILAAAGVADRYNHEERQRMATWKNERYRANLQRLTPADALPGAIPLLRALKERGFGIAIGSSSRNARSILDQLALASLFDAVVDGNDLERGKPDPQVFLLGAKRLGLAPGECIVVEDAVSGVRAGLAAGCAVVAIGSAADAPEAERTLLRGVDVAAIGDELLRALGG